MDFIFRLINFIFSWLPSESVASLPGADGRRFQAPILPLSVRKQDPYGNGSFGSSRDGGARKHEGIDFIGFGGDPVYAPFSGKVIRTTRPYANDDRFDGIVIEDDSGEFEAKLFYLKPRLKAGEKFNARNVLGIIQNLYVKYPSITNHVHLELRKNGVLIDPTPYFKSTF